jgi:XrtJ-associated TM-motif-TM protein
MKKSLLYVSLALTLLVAARPALAQTGCDDSPENPTLILAGLAGGVYAANTLRMRIRARRAVQNREN